MCLISSDKREYSWHPAMHFTTVENSEHLVVRGYDSNYVASCSQWTRMDDGLELMQSMEKTSCLLHIPMKADDNSCLLSLDLGYRMY